MPSALQLEEYRLDFARSKNIWPDFVGFENLNKQGYRVICITQAFANGYKNYTK